MFFRNLTLFRFSPAVADGLDLIDALNDHALRAPGPMEIATAGFVPPAYSEDAVLVLTVGHFSLFAVGRKQRLLPAAVLNQALAEKVRQVAAQEGRRVGGRERRRLRDDLLTEMLPRAFVQHTRVLAYVDRHAGWLVVDTSSRKVAEGVVSMVREALGSFPAVPPAPEESPRLLLTDWLANGKLPAGLSYGDECELRDPSTATGAIAISRRQDLDADEVREHLRNGKQVTRLGLVLDDRISFVLGDDLVVRKLRLLDIALDDLPDDQEDAFGEASAQFTLLSLEVERLLSRTAEWFGLPRPADAR